MLDVAGLGIVCTVQHTAQPCWTNAHTILIHGQKLIVFATSHHYPWSLRVLHQICKSNENYCIMLIKRCLNCIKGAIKCNGMFYPRVPTCGVYGYSFSGHHTCLCNSGSLQSWTSCQAVCENASL